MPSTRPSRPTRRPLALALALTVALVLGLAAAGSAQAPAAAPTAAEQAAQALLTSQDWTGAAAAFERAIAAGASPNAHLHLSIALHNLGRYDDALAALTQAESAGVSPIAVAMRRARTYLRLGRLDEAFTAVDAATAAGFGALGQLDTDPELAPLRSDPRFAARRTAVEDNAKPCLRNPAYRKFDFWIGEWDVFPTGNPPAPGAPVSQSSIQLIADGCVILENYTSVTGYTGKSFNLWDAAKGRWQQTYIDNQGSLLEVYGQFRDDGNLYFEGPSQPPGSTGTLENRLTFFNLGEGGIRQVWEQSRDGGKTFTTVFDGTYRRRTDPPQ